MPHDAYALLDCGDGRRLERFGDLVTDRPAPAALEAALAPERWAGAVIYHPGSGWIDADGGELAPVTEAIEVGGVTIEVRPAAGGQVGLFPEQLQTAAWLGDAVRARAGTTDARGRPGPPEVLNLFAYTGLATLVAAAAGASVVHVDASRPAVAWARRNAERSGLEDRPVRWIVDDALAFVRRESRRGRRYDGLVLDPPTYGHGGQGGRGGQAAWRFDERIMELLDACAGVARPDAFWLLTTHTIGWDAERLVAALRTATDAGHGELEGQPLQLEAESGAVLRLGAMARLDPDRGERR